MLGIAYPLLISKGSPSNVFGCSYEPQKRPHGAFRPGPRVETEHDPFREVAENDPDKRDPSSPLMREIARLAIGFALD